MSSSVIVNVDDNDATRYHRARILTAAGFKVLDAATAVILRGHEITSRVKRTSEELGAGRLKGRPRTTRTFLPPS